MRSVKLRRRSGTSMLFKILDSRDSQGPTSFAEHCFRDEVRKTGQCNRHPTTENVTASAQVFALNQTITNIRENAMAVRVGNRRLRSPLPVITITGKSSASGYADADWGFDMAVSGAQLNRFEQFLFRAAIVLAGLLIVARIVAMVLLAFAHHTR